MGWEFFDCCSGVATPLLEVRPTSGTSQQTPHDAPSVVMCTFGSMSTGGVWVKAIGATCFEAQDFSFSKLCPARPARKGKLLHSHNAGETQTDKTRGGKERGHRRITRSLSIFIHIVP